MKLNSPKLGVLYTRDHRKHVVIRRQLGSFVAAGLDVAVLDQAERRDLAEALPYRYRRLPRRRFEAPTKFAWRLIRRVPADAFRARFWGLVLRFTVLSNALRMALAAIGERPDVYLAEDLESALAALMAAKIHRRPVLYCAHELESEQGDRDPTRVGFLRRLQRLVVPRVDRLVTPNRARAAHFREQYGTRSEPRVILNCPPLAPANRTDVLRQVLGVGKEIRLVLYHGAFIPYRALDQLVRAAGCFDENIALVLMGEQNEYFHAVLQPLIESVDARGRVFVLPFVPPEEVGAYVASADLGVVIYENVNLNNYYCAPLKLYEYIMMRVPVVGSNFPEITDLLREYPIGDTFDPADPGSIACAVNGFFASTATRREEIQSHLARARERFTWEREATKWLDLIRQVREGSSPDECALPGWPEVAGESR